MVLPLFELSGAKSHFDTMATPFSLQKCFTSTKSFTLTKDRQKNL